MPSKTLKQAKLMAACSHGADYAACPPKEVAKDFNQADKKTGILKLKEFIGESDYRFSLNFMLENYDDATTFINEVITNFDVGAERPIQITSKSSLNIM